MKLKDYFFICMRENLYMNREWILRCFSIIPRNNETTEALMPSFIDGKCVFTDNDGNVNVLDDYVHRQPLLSVTKPVDVTPDEFPSFDKKTVSSYGNMTVGMTIFKWALGSKIPFLNSKEPMSGSKLDSIVSKAIKDKVLDIQNDYKRYIQALDFCSVFTDFLTPVGSKDMFLPKKEVIQLRDKLLKEYEGRLDEPEIAALVEGEITKLDRSLFKGDKAEGFLSGKMYNTVRKKANYVGGVSDNMRDPTKVSFTESSLKEGWGAKDLPVMVNSSRSGSHGRGVSVASAGVFTKYLMRSFSGAKIGSDDCGTKLGLPVQFDKGDEAFYGGRYDAKTGKHVKVEAGKKVILRDPAGCQEPDGNVCKMCLGDNVANSEASLASLCVAFSGGLLQLKMSAFHSKDISLEKVDLRTRLV